MRIDGLELYLAKRLLVRGIKHFKVDYTSPYQIVLGTNGSGKSYILSESSPLPAIPAMFETGGYKKINIFHNGSNFECTNTFDGKAGVHSFIVDGVELNGNGTSTIQKELVEKYFSGLDLNLFYILTGRKGYRFTDMNSNDRRMLLMKLSGTDLDWAMIVYNALRTRARDAAGHVKRLNQKLAVETQSVVDEINVEAMEKQLKTYQEGFGEVLRSIKQGIPTLDVINQTLDVRYKQMEYLSNTLDRHLRELTSSLYIPGVFDRISLDKHIAQLGTKIEGLDNILAQAYEDKQRVDGDLRKLKELGSEGLSEYREIIQKFRKELDVVDEKLKTFDYPNFDRKYLLPMVTGVDNMSQKLTACLTNMFDNSTGIITLEKTDEYRTEEVKLKYEMGEINRKIEAINHRLEHSKEVSDVECPSCSFVFKPGFSNNFMEEAPKALERFNIRIKEIEARLGEINSYLDKHSKMVAGLHDYERITQMFSGYNDLWEKLGDYGLETKSPYLAINIVDNFSEFLKLTKHFDDVMAEMIEKEKIYEQAIQLGSKDMESTTKLATDLEKVIEKSLSERANIRRSKDELTRLSSNLVQIEETLYASTVLVNEFESALELEQDALANDYLESVLRQLQESIESLEVQVSTVRVQRAIVDDLKKTVEQAKFDQDLYKLMVDELSPTDGLIADNLKMFVESFTENLNGIIDSIWTYSLKVLPCISKKEGLDYKFPIRVFGSNLPISDVSEGSDAQVDVVDFGVKLMVMALLNLEDFPLFLDEPISRMDEMHRVEMIRIIQSLVESNQCSQVFFISHFAAQHGSFPESEVLVMDSSNIVNLPTLYNQHCIIK